MKSILVTTSSFAQNNSDLLKTIEDSGLEVILNPYKRKLSETEVISLLLEFNPIGMIAGVEPLTKKAIESCGNLKIISRCGIGLDSVDLDAAKSNGVVVTNTPDAPTVPVAELTLGLILCLLRRIHHADASIRSDKWYRPMGNLLYRKTVGIVGCGRIGTYIAKLLTAFGCRILGCDPVSPTNQDIQMVGLDLLLNESDIITLHLPYDEENHHFIDKGELIQMKKGAFLINASRGGLVNESALYHALQTGHLKGAAIDSFETEPYTGQLKKIENILLSSHIGSYAIEGRMQMELQAVENLIDSLKIMKVIS